MPSWFKRKKKQETAPPILGAIADAPSASINGTVVSRVKEEEPSNRPDDQPYRVQEVLGNTTTIYAYDPTSGDYTLTTRHTSGSHTTGNPTNTYSTETSVSFPADKVPFGFPKSVTVNRDPSRFDLDHIESIKPDLSWLGQGKVKLKLIEYEPLPSEANMFEMEFTGYDEKKSKYLDIYRDGRVLAEHLDCYTIKPEDYPGSFYLDPLVPVAQPLQFNGALAGTWSVRGFCDNYRSCVVRSLFTEFECNTVPWLPGIPTLESLVTRIQNLPEISSHDELLKLLNMEKSYFEDYSFLYDPSLGVKESHAICAVLNRLLYIPPAEFPQFDTIPAISTQFFDGPGSIGTRAFLYAILLGAELAIRLKKETDVKLTQYMFRPSSALMVLAVKFMENVRVEMNGYLVSFHPLQQSKHTESFLKFAELMQWPFLDETKAFLGAIKLPEHMANLPHPLLDWLYGLHRPGWEYSALLLDTLVASTPSLGLKTVPPKYSGLVLPSTSGIISYWPTDSTLGHVLGGLPRPDRTGYGRHEFVDYCGILGPIKAAVRVNGREKLQQPDWFVIAGNATVRPAMEDTSHDVRYARLGLDSENVRKITTKEIYNRLAQKDNWIIRNAWLKLKSSEAELLSIELDEEDPVGGQVKHVASLRFRLKRQMGPRDYGLPSIEICWQLASNPVFVTAPRCGAVSGGHHPMFNLAKEAHPFVPVFDLLSYSLPERLDKNAKVVIIDARGYGEDCVARAYCAQMKRNAIIKNGASCCMPCAITLASKDEGLGFGIVIWVSD